MWNWSGNRISSEHFHLQADWGTSYKNVGQLNTTHVIAMTVVSNLTKRGLCMIFIKILYNQSVICTALTSPSGIGSDSFEVVLQVLYYPQLFLMENQTPDLYVHTLNFHIITHTIFSIGLLHNWVLKLYNIYCMSQLINNCYWDLKCCWMIQLSMWQDSVSCSGKLALQISQTNEPWRFTTL